MMQRVAFSSSIVYSALVVVMMMAATGTGTGSGGLSVVQATTLVDDILTTVSSTSSSSSDFVHWMAEHFHFQEEQDEKTKTNGVSGQSAVAAAVPLQFFTWMQEHSKSYETQEETHQRLQIWNTNAGMYGDGTGICVPPCCCIRHPTLLLLLLIPVSIKLYLSLCFLPFCLTASPRPPTAFGRDHSVLFTTTLRYTNQLSIQYNTIHRNNVFLLLSLYCRTQYATSRTVLYVRT